MVEVPESLLKENIARCPNVTNDGDLLLRKLLTHPPSLLLRNLSATTHDDEPCFNRRCQRTEPRRYEDFVVKIYHISVTKSVQRYGQAADTAIQAELTQMLAK